MIRRNLTIICFAMLASCSSDERAVQGPGSETSGFSARVLDVAGKPVAGASVRAVALDRSWQKSALNGVDPVVGRAVSDSDGMVRFGLVSGVARVALEIGDADRSGRVELDAKPGSSARLSLEVGGAVRIDARVPRETIGGVRLAGTGYTAVRETSGAWVFSSVATGWYTVAALTDSGMAVLGRVAIRSGVVLDTALSADVDSVLLEDFAVPPVRNRYGGVLGAGWWYTSVDSAYGGKSTVSPADPSSALVRCADGNCLEMRFRIDPSDPANFALVGLDLDRSSAADGSDVRLADLTRVGSLRFDAIGRGGIAVQIHYGTGGASSTCAATIALDSVRTKREIPLATMTCDGFRPLDRTKAVGITFLAQEDVDLRLGRIVLVGAGPRSVFPDLELGGSP
ncbi:MAG: hypothetical protein RL173_3449 [Fibrobacterota bacterium]|jgi:hypothetical protein